jgi:hypothetical protein
VWTRCLCRSGPRAPVMQNGMNFPGARSQQHPTAVASGTDAIGNGTELHQTGYADVMMPEDRFLSVALASRAGILAP